MNGTFNNGLDVLYHHAKFGESEQRAPAVGAKILCLPFLFFLSCSEAGALFVRRRHILNKYCVTAYGTISILFSLFLFRMDSPFSQTSVFAFPLPAGAIISAKLQSKIAKNVL